MNMKKMKGMLVLLLMLGTGIVVGSSMAHAANQPKTLGTDYVLEKNV